MTAGPPAAETCPGIPSFRRGTSLGGRSIGHQSCERFPQCGEGVRLLQDSVEALSLEAGCMSSWLYPLVRTTRTSGFSRRSSSNAFAPSTAASSGPSDKIDLFPAHVKIPRLQPVGGGQTVKPMCSASAPPGRALSSSSTSRIVPVRSRVDPGGGFVGRLSPLRPGAAGKRSLNVVPFPGSLYTLIAPLCEPTIPSTAANPNPRPVTSWRRTARRSATGSSRPSRSRYPSLPGVHTAPGEGRRVTHIAEVFLVTAGVPTDTVIAPLRSPSASDALMIRFVTICRIWVGSAWIGGTPRSRFRVRFASFEIAVLSRRAISSANSGTPPAPPQRPPCRCRPASGGTDPPRAAPRS